MVYIPPGQERPPYGWGQNNGNSTTYGGKPTNGKTFEQMAAEGGTWGPGWTAEAGPVPSDPDSPAGSGYSSYRPANAGGSFGIRNVDQAGLEGIGGDLQGQIQDILRGAMTGKDVPFSMDTITALKSRAKSAAEGGARGSMESLKHHLAKTGMARSPASMRQMTDIRRQAQSDYSQASNSIQVQAAVKNYEARMSALKQAQTSLDRQRDYILNVTKVGVARDTALAQIELAYANIDAAMERAQKELEYRYTALDQSMDTYLLGLAMA